MKTNPRSPLDAFTAFTDGERILIDRAGAHCVAVPGPDAQFREGVTDLDVARLMRGLENNPPISVVRNPVGRWYAESNRFTGRSVSNIVGEMIRTGLLTHVHDRAGHHLVPAKVHLCATDALVTRCREPGEGMGPKRVRLATDPVMVDCLACLAQL